MSSVSPVPEAVMPLPPPMDVQVEEEGEEQDGYTEAEALVDLYHATIGVKWKVVIRNTWVLSAGGSQRESYHWWREAE